MNRCSILLIVFFIFIVVQGAQATEWNPAPTEATLFLQKSDIPLCLLYLWLPQDYYDFYTKEAISCRLKVIVGPMDNSRVIGNAEGLRDYLVFGNYKWTVTLNNIYYSSWEAANFQIIAHELTHCGAKGTGTDAQGDKQMNEVGARIREAEYWKDIQPKPPRDTTKGPCDCWANYDIVFNKDGTQKSHEEIKQALKAMGYSDAEM